MKKLNYLWLLLAFSPSFTLSAGAVADAASNGAQARFVRVEDMIVMPADAHTEGQVAATVGEFVIVRKQEDGESGEIRAFNAESQATLVIHDLVVGDYGLSDGTFFVFFREAGAVEDIVREHGLRVEDLFVNARMVRVSVADGRDVFVVMEQVQQDARVREVELNTTFDRLAPY